MGEILVGKPQHQLPEILRKTLRKLDFANRGQPGVFFWCQGLVLKRRISGKQLKYGDTQGVVVSLPVPDALHGFRGGVKRRHAGGGNHKGGIARLGADAEVNQHHMLSGVIGNHVGRLHVLVEDAGLMNGPESLVNRRDNEFPEILGGKAFSGGQRLGKGRILIPGHDHVLVFFQGAVTQNRSHAGILHLPELIHDFRLYGVFPAVELQDKTGVSGLISCTGYAVIPSYSVIPFLSLIPSDSLRQRTEIDIRLAGLNAESPFHMVVPQDESRGIRNLRGAVVNHGSLELFQHGVDSGFGHIELREWEAFS